VPPGATMWGPNAEPAKLHITAHPFQIPACIAPQYLSNGHSFHGLADRQGRRGQGAQAWCSAWCSEYAVSGAVLRWYGAWESNPHGPGYGPGPPVAMWLYVSPN
jgi:hypothetical protein